MCEHKWNNFPENNPRYLICTKCGQVKQIQSNADRIREMSNEELAESRIHISYGECGELEYRPVGARVTYFDKEKAIQAELEWLNKEFVEIQE